jgi:hypothetical protein
MRFVHPAHPGRCVRLGYCMNLHAARTLDEWFDALRRVTLPLRERLHAGRESFGVGMYLPAALAFELVRDLRARERVIAFLEAERLDAFSYNAFPYEHFQSDELKARVYAPDWSQPERLAYTLAVAQLALNFREAREGEQISISTHAGGFGADLRHEPRAQAAREGLQQAAVALDALARDHGRRIVLSLEAEPRSNANDTRDAAALVRSLGAGLSSLGLCLDACHSAVEFEDPRASARLALTCGNFGKLQYSSALVCRTPEQNPQAYAALLAMAEPRFLHQVTGRAGERELAWLDLDELRQSGPKGAEELRCHFHVPVDAESLGPLGTTRDHARLILEELLRTPQQWGSQELHVEIETYTWQVLPETARGAAREGAEASEGLISALEREYRAVMGELSAAGWHRA